MIRFLIASAFVIGACAGMPDHDWTDDSTVEDCAPACENLQRLRCPGADGSPGADREFGTTDDRTCKTVCEEIMEEGEKTLYPKCVAAARTCQDVDACFVD